MKRITDLLMAAVDRPEVIRAARANHALRHWDDVVGPAMAKNLQPERYDRGTVWVAATGSSWAQELRLCKDEVVERLNQHAGDTLFRDLRVGVRPLPQRG